MSKKARKDRVPKTGYLFEGCIEYQNILDVLVEKYKGIVSEKDLIRFLNLYLIKFKRLARHNSCSITNICILQTHSMAQAYRKKNKVASHRIKMRKYMRKYRVRLKETKNTNRMIKTEKIAFEGKDYLIEVVTSEEKLTEFKSPTLTVKSAVMLWDLSETPNKREYLSIYTETFTEEQIDEAIANIKADPKKFLNNSIKLKNN